MMRPQTPAERKARAMIHAKGIGALITTWEMLRALPATPENLIAARWIADELEARNPAAYSAWETETWEIDSPRNYFLPA